MSLSEKHDLAAYCRDVAGRAKVTSRALSSVSGGRTIAWPRRAATLLRARYAPIAAAIERDLAAAPDYGLTDAEIDRLRLTPQRVESIAVGMEEVAALPEPIGEVISSTIRPNGLDIRKVRVLLGVVFFIYESRPNVT